MNSVVSNVDKPVLQVIGFMAGIGTTISFVPQVVRVWTNKSTQDLSLCMFSVHTLGACLWIVYGVVKGDIIIITFNSITLLLCLFMLMAFMKFSSVVSCHTSLPLHS